VGRGDVTPRDEPAIRKITIRGAIVNVALAAVKMAVGVVTGSVSLIADGVHSLGDLVTDGIVLLGVHISAAPPDESHQYGHGRFETFAAIAVAIVLIAAGAGLAWKAGDSLYRHEHLVPGLPVLLVALVSIASKEVLYRRTRAVGIRTGSPSLMANAWHHRSDALSSVAVLAGAVAGLAGWSHADQVAGIIVGLMVVSAGGRVAWDGFQELAEHAVEKDVLDRIRECLDTCPDLRGWHRLRTRRVGREVFMDVHVLLDPDLSVAAGHRIVSDLEETIYKSIDTPVSFSIHMEPDVPSQRQGS
jgi:cation diffusion facilitator family transporter